MLQEYKSNLERFHMNNETIKIGIFETIKSYEAYGFGADKHSQHLVNNLSNIGWTDPFPTPIKIKAKHVDPKPSKEDIQRFIEQAKEYNQNLLSRDFMHKTFRINPLVHIVKMRASQIKLRNEYIIQ